MRLGTKIGLMALSVAALTTGAFSRIGTNAPKESTETIRLHHIKPSDFLRAIAATAEPGTKPTIASLRPMRTHPIMPDDIRQIDTDDTTGKLVIHGDSEGIAKLRTIARVLDVDVPTVKFDINILRSPLRPEYFANGKHTLAPREGEIVGTGSVRLKNDEEADVAVVAEQHLFLAHLKPHVLGNGKVSVGVQLTTESQGAADPNNGKDALRPLQRNSITNTVVLGKDTGSGSGPNFVVPSGASSTDGTYFFELVPHTSH